MAQDGQKVEVTFLRSGLYVDGRITQAGTVEAIDAATAHLTPDEQVDKFGAHMFDVGAAQGAPHASLVDPDPATRKVQLLTVEDAATILNRTPETVYRMAHNGKLPHRRGAGGRLLFDMADVWRLHRDPERLAMLADGVERPRTVWASTMVGHVPPPSMAEADRAVLQADQAGGPDQAQAPRPVYRNDATLTELPTGEPTDAPPPGVVPLSPAPVRNPRGRATEADFFPGA